MFEGMLGFDVFTSLFSSQDFYGTVHADLADPNEMGIMLVGLVRQNTPQDTTALYDSIKYEPDTDHGKDGIVHVYADDAEQLASWNRIYVAYQEGGALGMPTYTNEPHEMFAKALAQYDVIMNLEQQIAQRSMDRLAQGLGKIF